MIDNKKPWDNIYLNNSNGSTTNPIESPMQAHYLSTNESTEIETIAGKKVKYGLGKPTRISIKGDLKHGSDQ